MYCIHYEYGDIGRYFETGDEVYNELMRSNFLHIEPYVSYLGILTPKQVEEMPDRICSILDVDALTTPIDDLMLLRYDLDDDEIIFPCSKEKYNNSPVEVINGVANYYGLGFCVVEIKKLTIVVVDSDNEPLVDMFPCPALTLWHDVKSFILDTQFYITTSDNSARQPVRTYNGAVRYWKHNYYEVLSNYNENAIN